MFELVDTTPGVYLHHRSRLGEFWLTSDTAIPTFRKKVRIAHIIEQMPEELATFERIGYTIGGMMIFPCNQIDRKQTINQARGRRGGEIGDRFDLTLECIRRHYLYEDCPLSDVIARYAEFFNLFGDFRGYVEFFLLQDLVTDDCTSARFFSPFENFTTSPVPGSSIEAYRAYRQLAIKFIEARNSRILHSY